MPSGNSHRPGLRPERVLRLPDSITDLPMLAAVGHPTAVNPDRALRREATTAGWPILSFDRPVGLATAPPSPARWPVSAAAGAGVPPSARSSTTAGCAAAGSPARISKDPATHTSQWGRAQFSARESVAGNPCCDVQVTGVELIPRKPGKAKSDPEEKDRTPNRNSQHGRQAPTRSQRRYRGKALCTCELPVSDRQPHSPR